MKKAGFIQDGKLQEAVVIEKLSKHGDKAMVEKAVKKCAAERGANDCQTALKQHTCFRANIKQQ